MFDYTTLNEIIIFDGPGDVIEVERDGKYINLKKPVDKRRMFRFNLQKGKFERLNFYKTVEDKVTEVPIKNITQWFYNCKLITKDLHFGRLMIFAKYHNRFSSYSSPARFVQALNDKMILAIEQWEALGIKVEEVEHFFNDFLVSRSYDYTEDIFLGKVDRQWSVCYYQTFNISPSDLGKRLLDYVKKNYTTVNNAILTKLSVQYGNGEYVIEKKLRKLEEDPEFVGLFEYEDYTGRVWSMFNRERHSSIQIKVNLIHVIQEYNLDILSFCKWLKRQKNVEFNDIQYFFGGTNHYIDYLRTEKALRNGSFSKMVKYPKNFRTVFHQNQVEYQTHQAEIDEQRFLEISEKNNNLEYQDKKYSIVIPKTPANINHEASELYHCVRIYIKPMLQEQTLIVFLRENKKINTPFITIEVKKGKITQAFGKHDSKPPNEALDFIYKWAKEKNLEIGCWKKYFLNR